MIEIGAIGYAMVAGLYLLLTVLLLTAWRGQRIGSYLIVACVVSAIWGGVLAVQTGRGPIHPWSLFGIEVLRAGVWILFLTRLLREIGGSAMVRLVANLIWLSLIAAGLGLWVFTTYFNRSTELGLVLFPGGLATSLAGLVLIEQIYRNSPPESRWSLKLLLMGLGGMFAYDMFLYSQAILFNALDEASWLARGAVNVIFVPLIAVATRRNPEWNLRIFVSRQVVFYSTTLTAVGLYLLLMSAGSYLIIRYGGSWGGVAQMVFFVGAGVVLIALLFSTSLRANVKVFLSKHFFQNKYDYREEWRNLIATLSKFEDSSTREVVVYAMAKIVGSPSGFLWMLDEDGKTYRLTAAYETDEVVPDLPASDPVVRFMNKDGWVVDLAEYAQFPDRYDNLTLPAWIQQRNLAWLLLPLIHSNEIIGIVLLSQAPGPHKLNYEDRDLLKTVGNHIAVHLAQERSDRLLTEARQFETYNRLSTFLMHDLNNLIAQQSLIVKNAEKHRRNPDFVDDAIDTIANSVGRMSKLMEQLKQGEEDQSRRSVALGSIVNEAIARCSNRKPEPNSFVDAGATVSANAEEFAMVLSHLIRNSQDATAEDGHVNVEVVRKDGAALIKVTDSGTGMTKEFIRDRLFRPFDSTKGVEGMGIGVYQAREFARKLGGDLQVESEPGEGTTVTLSVPLE